MDALQSVERIIERWMSRFGAASARISLGIVFVWFGALKLTGMSPANALVTELVSGAVDAEWFIYMLGAWEVLIGALLIIGGRTATRVGLLLLFAHIPGTFLPVIALPHLVFAESPFGLTFEGQYIAKNLVLISAALVVGGNLYRDRAAERPRPHLTLEQTHG